MTPRGVRGATSKAILVILSNGDMSTHQMAARLQHTSQYMGMVIKRLKKCGWVGSAEIVRDSMSNRKLNLWRITDDGRSALEISKVEVGEGGFEDVRTKVDGPETMSVDGETWAKCKHCERKGYGADSWSPATGEFFRSIGQGYLLLTQCLACFEEHKRGNVGFIPENFELTRKAA